MESICFIKTLKLQKFCKMPHERCETGAVLCRNFLKIFQNGFKVIYEDQTTIEVSELPTICIFQEMKSSSLIFQNSGIFISFITSLSPNWATRVQSCISCIKGDRKTKINIYWNYQGRTYIWDAFFNFGKLQNVLITDSAGSLTEELLFRIPVFTECHYWLIINAQANYARPKLPYFDKTVEIRDTLSRWLTYFI